MELKKLPILYSRSTTGKISTWEIEYTEDSYRTISGFYGMKLVTSEWTKCDGKSYNTTAEQTKKEAKALWKKKVESGMFEDINKVDEETFFEPMLAKDLKKEKINWKYRVFIQPKLDGLRNINRNNKQFSRNGKEFVCTPHLNQNELTFDGEMYNHSLKDNFNEIISLCRKTKPTQEDLEASEKMVEYWVYDLPTVNGVFSKRYEILKEWMWKNKPQYFKLVPTFEIFNQEDINRYHEQFLEEGYEGSMIRIDSHNYENKRSKSLLKNKNFFDEEFIIKGIEEGIGKLKNKVGVFNFEINGNFFNSAVNGSHEYLEDLWNRRDEIIGKEATVKYFNLTPEGIPRFPKVIAIRDYE
jgi:DNA ligase-1